MADLTRRDAIRIGTAERQAAANRLEEHLIAGRLEPQEFSDRLGAAHVAIHRNELDVLFEDLPKSSTMPGERNLPRLRVRRRAPLRWMLMWTVGALSPFLALLCFFAIHQTPAWFFLVPVSVVIAQLADRHPVVPSVRRRRRY